MKVKYGYCGMTCDFLHIGHIRFMSQCKSKCEKLIVGIMTDSCIRGYKGRPPLMKETDRAEIVSSLNFVYRVQFQNEFNFSHNVIRMKELWGDDFIIFDSEEHNRKGADILIPRTPGISSTIIKRDLNENFNFSQCSI